MRLDPGVHQRKLQHEFAILRARSDDLRVVGCEVVEIGREEVRCVFTPRSPVIRNRALLSLGGVPCAIPPPLPPFGVRVFLDDYDVLAPSVVFCDPATWKHLPQQRTPYSCHHQADGQRLQVVLPMHPTSGKVFLCLPGTREFHSHPEHDGTSWAGRRAGSSVFSLLRSLGQVCVVDARPEVTLQLRAGA